MGKELPGVEGRVGNVMEQASTSLLSDSRAGVEVWKWLIKETSQKPCLAGACESCKNCNHIPQWQTAGLQSLVNDLLSSFVSELR